MLLNGAVLYMSVRECFSREVTFEHTGSGWVSNQIIWEEEYSRCETSKYKGSEIPDMLKEYNVVGEQRVMGRVEDQRGDGNQVL